MFNFGLYDKSLPFMIVYWLFLNFCNLCNYNLSTCWGTVTILLPRAYARGKVIGRVVVVMDTTIAKFGDLGT